ncbi:hypothetical protein [uncultured Sulfitobacter sp.]|uniref:hypothetical protein n=1 Tax=uncultured Sulfitobacter sp. TaxID=191468 RepID=UPI002610141F|nr:hypothetical protein [uncultured Sulfitobacter sp.]
MRASAPEGFAKALRAIPLGTSVGRVESIRYTATRSDFNNGRSIKLVAEALDQSDYVSLNFYDLESGGQLAPCEMQHDKVVDFIMAYCPETETSY